MREFRDIINDVLEAVSSIEMPIKVITEFENALIDTPLYKPVVAIGMRSVEIEAEPFYCYAGKSGDKEQYSTPVRIEVSANIYLPKNLKGQISYDLLSLMTSALLESETCLYKVTTEQMRYDRNFLCVVLPVTFHIHERALNEN